MLLRTGAACRDPTAASLTQELGLHFSPSFTSPGDPGECRALTAGPGRPDRLHPQGPTVSREIRTGKRREGTVRQRVQGSLPGPSVQAGTQRPSPGWWALLAAFGAPL